MAIDASWKHAGPIRAFVYAHFRISWLLPADIKRICAPQEDLAGSYDSGRPASPDPPPTTQRQFTACSNVSNEVALDSYAFEQKPLRI